MSAELSPEIAQIDALLRRAADGFSYPPTPSLVEAVVARVSQRERAGRWTGALESWWGWPALRVALAVLAVTVLIVGAALAVPQSRSALAKFFGLSHVRIEVHPTYGPTPPALSPQSFARPASVDEAQRVVDFPLRFPTRGDARLSPDAVYIQGEVGGLPVAIFVYEHEGFDLYQTDRGSFFKEVPGIQSAHQISFAGHDAYWIDEGGHIATFLDAQGRLVIESRRTVGRATLMWEVNGITYRLETSLSQAEAMRVAESLK